MCQRRGQPSARPRRLKAGALGADTAKMGRFGHGGVVVAMVLVLGTEPASAIQSGVRPVDDVVKALPALGQSTTPDPPSAGGEPPAPDRPAPDAPPAPASEPSPDPETSTPPGAGRAPPSSKGRSATDRRSSASGRRSRSRPREGSARRRPRGDPAGGERRPRGRIRRKPLPATAPGAGLARPERPAMPLIADLPPYLWAPSWRWARVWPASGSLRRESADGGMRSTSADQA